VKPEFRCRIRPGIKSRNVFAEGLKESPAVHASPLGGIAFTQKHYGFAYNQTAACRKALLAFQALHSAFPGDFQRSLPVPDIYCHKTGQ